MRVSTYSHEGARVWMAVKEWLFWFTGPLGGPRYPEAAGVKATVGYCMDIDQDAFSESYTAFPKSLVVWGPTRSHFF